MDRAIVAFREDASSDWIAELACGHRRHVRHNPPLSERAWVLSPEGRAAQIGSELACAACDRKEIPAGYAPYRRTPVYDESTIPSGLLRDHSTRRGVWARIHVTQGSLDYYVHAPFHSHERLSPMCIGIVIPEVEHHIATHGPVSFFVEFLRSDDGSSV